LFCLKSAVLELFRGSQPPFDARPGALVEIIKANLGNDFRAGNKSAEVDLACNNPADNKCVDGPHRAPAHGFDERAPVHRMRAFVHQLFCGRR